MRLATVLVEGRRQVAVVDPQERFAWPVSWLVPRAEAGEGADMIDFIARAARVPADIQPVGSGIPLDSLTFEAPVPGPVRGIFRMSRGESGDAPRCLGKTRSLVVGAGAPIPLGPGADLQMQCEIRLGVVIGAGGRAIRSEDASRHIWGYTIVSEVAGRVARAGPHPGPGGTSPESCCSIGPWIVGVEELESVDLKFRCWINGELRQAGNAGELLAGVPALVATLSASHTLEPGDLITMPAPVGAGPAAFQSRFLRDGDVVEIEVEGIGRLSNPVRRGDASRAPLAAPPAGATMAQAHQTGLGGPVRRVALAADRCGCGPALILVHGLGGSANTWLPLVMDLRNRFTLIVPELAGAGRSPREGEVSIERHVADILALMDENGIEKAHVAGHAMGTLVVQHLAARHSERIESLLLVNPINDLPEAARAALRARAAKARAEGMAGIVDAVVEMGTSADTKTDQPAVVALVRETVLRQDPEGYARNCEALAAARAADPVRIRCPVLLLTGYEDKIATPAMMHALARAIPRATARGLIGCGHWAPLERARQVTHAYKGFLGEMKVAA